MTLLGRYFLTLFFGLILLAFPFHTLAEDEENKVNSNPLTATAKIVPYQVAPGGTAEVVIEMELAGEYHAYLDRFKLVGDGPNGIKVDDFKITPIVKFMDTFSKSMKEGVEKKATMRAMIEVAEIVPTGKLDAHFKLTYQACTTDHCLFPKTLALVAPLQVNSTATKSSGPSVQAPPDSAGSVPAETTDFQKALNQGLLPALILVFFMGFLTSLTPCVYPMIPITLAVIGSHAKGVSRMRSFLFSVVYVLGIALTYSILGVIAASTGALFGSALSNIWVVTGIAVIFVAMGLSMYGLYELQVPGFIRNSLGATKSEAGFIGAFVTGLIAGVVASPCIGPVLVSILTYIAQSQDKGRGFLLLFSFALGMGILFIVLGTFSNLVNKVPRAGRWMELTKFIFGTLMVGMALYYVQPLYPSWLFNLLSGLALILITSAYGAFEPNDKLHGMHKVRKGLMLALFIVGVALVTSASLEKAGVKLATGGSEGSPAASESYAKLAWQPYTNAALEAALKEKKPIIMDFFADWCVACKELERFTFTDDRIRAASHDFALLKIDATEDSPELQRLKSRYKVLGLPTMVFFDSSGKERGDLTVTGFENADKFLARMKSAKDN